MSDHPANPWMMQRQSNDPLDDALFEENGLAEMARCLIRKGCVDSKPPISIMLDLLFKK